MRLRRLALLAAAATALAAPVVAPLATADDPEFSATVYRTTAGIPHVVADDYKGIGYGYGYSIAQDNLCVLADTYMTVDAQRSKYLGPDAGYVFRGNGYGVNNLNSDFFFQQIIDDQRVEKLLAQPAPLGPRQEVRDGVTGYVAGYNRWVRETHNGQDISDPACKGAPWVHEITEIDAYRRFYQLALLASSGVAIDGIGSAQPPAGLPSAPGAKAGSTPSALDDPQLAAQDLGERFKTLAIGSNAVALGSAATTNGHGMLLGNPHFPWIGSERFYQAQLTIPGVLDVEGGSLYGVPIILIGHTDSMAWSHTVSTAYRFTPYQLTLVPGKPTQYLYDGKPRDMTSRTMTVQVKQSDGSVAAQTRTLWSTHYGPILTSLVGLPLFPWTPATAFAMRDANAANFRYVNHFLETDLAHSAAEELEVLQRNQGIPWVNTIVADKAGNALYADISVVPNVPDSLALACDTAIGAATFQLLRLPVLDGSRSSCEWLKDPDALQDGTFGPSHLPHLFRSDYVTNSNDSYWLSNPKQPLTGFARIIGDEGTARSLRTRSGLVMVEEQLAKGGFDRQGMQDMVFANRQYAAELARDAVVEACDQLPGQAPTSSGPPVAVGAACDVLRAWDRHDDLDSKGAVLFRRVWQRLTANPASPAPAAPIWLKQFDAADAVHTPNTLNPLLPQTRTAIGDAIADLKGAGIPLDGTLRDWQYVTRGSTRIPIHGGPGTVGVFNAINVGWNASKGFVEVPHGSSYVQVVSFDDTACPDTRTILTYSQSSDPTSPHFADQTQMFSQKQWVQERFCQADVLADPSLTTSTIEE